MTRLYLIRHGEAEGNLYRRMQGHYDGGLTDLGQRQVLALGERFRGEQLDAVYTSDLSRAMHTGMALGRPIHTDPRLREVCVGLWEDQCFGNVRADEPEQMFRFLTMSSDWSVPGAETFSAVADRGEAAIRDILQKHRGQTVAVCAHGTVLRCILNRMVYGDQVLSHHGTNTAVTMLTESSGELSLSYSNNVSHLSPELMHATPAGDFVIRPMAEDAVEEYIRYRKDAWQVVYGTLDGFDGPGFWLDAKRSMGKDPLGMVVAYLDGRPAGMIQLNPSRDADRGVGYIPFLYLREAYRHQGLGIQLIGHAVSFYRRLGRTKLQLSVYPKNEKALGFYYKYGFKKAKRHRGRFGHLLLMEKDIQVQKPAGSIIPVSP